jgi:hypothetical protein
MRKENSIQWVVGEPLSDAKIGNRSVPKSVWKSDIPEMRKTDSIVFFPMKPFLSMSVPVQGTTIEAVFHTLNDHLHQRIHEPKDDLRQMLYVQISQFYDRRTRMELIQKLESGELTWFELLGDYVAWGGNLRKTKANVWVYNLDS